MPHNKQKHHLPYNKWQKAFLVYATIYGQQYPQEWANLIKYADTIRELVSSNARWEFYDEEFRRNRVRTGWPWQSLQMELWGKAMTIFHEETKTGAEEEESKDKSWRTGPYQSTHKRWSGKNTTVGKSRPNAVGYCWPYNRGESCRGNCGYDHKCYKCQGNHRANECYQGNNNRTTSKRGPGLSEVHLPQ